VLDALEYIHANGVVHRDLKPENIMVDDDDNIKLIDFGIAGDAAARRLTYANFTAAIGTPNYISPEQVKGKRGDGRSDIYSMGVILYEMLTGKLPFNGPNPAGRHERAPAQPPHRPSRRRPLHHSATAGDSLPRPGTRSQKPLRQARPNFKRDLEHMIRSASKTARAARLAKAQIPALAQDSLLRRLGPDSGRHPADGHDPRSLIFQSPLISFFFRPC
jgi:serine/threonine protein kinase